MSTPHIMAMHAETHPGVLRSHNEDEVVVWPAHGVMAVFDGMGGSYSGYDAVEIAIQAVGEVLTQESSRDMPPEHRIRLMLERANAAILDAVSVNSRLRGSGAACACVQLVEDTLHWTHVGDCRLYRLRGGRLEQLTRDHTLLNHAIDTGHLITEEEIAAFPYRDVITNALGMEDDIRIDVAHDKVRSGDLYMACSDGLTDMLTDDEIAGVLTDDELSGEEIVERLVCVANMAGGRDNISVACMWIR